MSGGDDGDRDADGSDDEARDDEWFGRDDGSGDGDGPATVDDHDADASAESRREPLGALHDRVVDENEDAIDSGAATGSGDAIDSGAATGSGDAIDSGAATDSGDAIDSGAATGSGDAIDSGAATGSGDAFAGEDVDPSVPETGRDGPLGELAADVDGRRERKTKADDALFDEVDVGEVDADELWSQVESDGPTVEPRAEREVREVEKRKYCSQCPYFSDPPEVACSHEGTDILQQVDMEHFEVADCPIVLEDERLEDVTSE